MDKVLFGVVQQAGFLSGLCDRERDAKPVGTSIASDRSYGTTTASFHPVRGRLKPASNWDATRWWFLFPSSGR